MKKITLLITLFVCAIGFSQQETNLSDLGVSSDPYFNSDYTPPSVQAPCDLSGPGNAFENGKSFTMNLGRIVAHDITVNADENLMLQTINLNAFIGATGSGVNAAAVDVYIYANAAGSPGAVITSQLGMVPTSQTVVGNNFGFDVWDVALDIADVALAGQAGVPTTYWIGVSLEPTDGSNTFWENSTAGLIGFGEAYDDGLGGGYVIDSTLEGVYTFSGDCTPLGGGGTPCETVGPGNAFENGKSFTMNLGRIVAHDVTVNADEDFTLEMINLNAFIGATGSGVNAAAVDVYIYDDAVGSPGAVIASELGIVPTSQTVVGNNFGFDVWDVELDITDVLLPSSVGLPTTYWIGVSLEPTDGSNTFWENSTAGLVGLGEAYDDGLGGGFVVDSTLEGVYTFAGTCGGTAGVSENSLDGFAFYPNPTSQTLSLRSVENIDSVSLYNLLGQKVLETNVNATTSDVNVSELSTGTYIMKVTVNGQVGTYKVLKN